MPKTYNNVKIAYPKEGVIRSAQLSDTIAPEDSVQLGLNGNFDRIGSFQTRPGIFQYTTPLAGEILSFGTISIQETGLRRLLAQVANVISVWNGTVWATVRTMTSTTTKARYSQFLNLVYTVNGNATVAGSDPVATFDGTAYGTTNVGTLPKGDYVQAGFEGRVWVADKALDRLYYTDIVQPSGAGYVITGGSEFVEKLSPQDGQSITGLFRVPRALLVFKQNCIIRVYGASSVDPYPAYNVGTYSQESIVQAKDGVYFHHPSGFYKFAYDGQPIEISRRVKDFVDAIPRTNYEKITGLYDNNDNIVWSIGLVVVEGVSFVNCQLRYTISTNVWTIYDVSGPNTPSAMIVYDDGTLLLSLVGTTNGKVGRMFVDTKDFGLPIFYDMITRWLSYTEAWAKVKDITGVMVHSENAAGASFQYQTDKDAVDKWQDIGKIDSKYATLFPNMESEDFNRMRFRLKGVTSGEQIIFNGIELLSVLDKGYNEN